MVKIKNLNDIPQMAKLDGKAWGSKQTYRLPFRGDIGIYMNDAIKEGGRLALPRTGLLGTQTGYYKYIEFFVIGAALAWEIKCTPEDKEK